MSAVTLNRKKIEARLEKGELKTAVAKDLGIGMTSLHAFLLSDKKTHVVKLRNGKKKAKKSTQASSSVRAKKSSAKKANGVTKNYGDNPFENLPQDLIDRTNKRLDAIKKSGQNVTWDDVLAVVEKAVDASTEDFILRALTGE